MSNQEMCPPGFKSVAEWNGFRFIVESAVKSGYTPVKNVPQGIVIALRGRELGIPPIESLNTIIEVKGKLSVSAEGMLSLVFQKVPGVQCEYVTPHEKSHEEAEYEVTRPGGKTQSFKFTMKDASRAGINQGFSWKKYPAAMLRSRCVSAMVRAAFPEALAGGIYTPEEVEHFEGAAPPKSQLGAGSPGESSENRARLPRPKGELAPEVVAKIKKGEVVSSELKDYVIPEGSKKGKALHELKRIELSTLLGAVKKAKKTKNTQEIIKNVEEFLRSSESASVQSDERETSGPIPIGKIPGVANRLKEEDKYPFEK